MARVATRASNAAIMAHTLAPDPPLGPPEASHRHLHRKLHRHRGRARHAVARTGRDSREGAVHVSGLARHSTQGSSTWRCMGRRHSRGCEALEAPCKGPVATLHSEALQARQVPRWAALQSGAPTNRLFRTVDAPHSGTVMALLMQVLRVLHSRMFMDLLWRVAEPPWWERTRRSTGQSRSLGSWERPLRCTARRARRC